MKRLKDIGFYILRISITVGLLILLFYKIDAENIFEIIKGINLSFFVLAAILFALVISLLITRWLVLLRALDIRAPLLKIIAAYMAGLFCNLFLPSSIGGDLVRGLDLSRFEKSKPKLFATIILDRLSGFVCVVALTFFALLFAYKRFIADTAVLFSVGALVIILLSVLLVLFNKKIFTKLSCVFNRFNSVKQWLSNFSEYILFFRNKKRVLVYNLLLSLCAQMLGAVVFYFIAVSIGLDLSLIYFFIFVPIVNSIAILPITIGGLGLRDYFVVLFFAKVGVEKTQAVSLSLIWFSFMVAVGLLGGIIYVATLSSRRIQHR